MIYIYIYIYIYICDVLQKKQNDRTQFFVNSIKVDEGDEKTKVRQHRTSAQNYQRTIIIVKSNTIDNAEVKPTQREQ